MNDQKTDCSYCGEYHPEYGDICPRYEEHQVEDAQDAKAAQPSPAAVELALAQEKANQEQIGATVQAARASATQPQGERTHAEYFHLLGQFGALRDQRDALQAQRDELLEALKALVKVEDEESQFVAEEWDAARNAIARATEGGTGQ